MTYDELREKIHRVKADYLRDKGKELQTIAQLEEYLDERLVKRPRARGAKSLRGLFG